MNVEVTNRQDIHDIDTDALKKLAAWLMVKAAGMDADKIWVECSVVLMNARDMADLNESALQHDGTTDVITFCYPTNPGEPDGWRGEIVLNVELAYELGSERRGGADRELALYLAHGCQHLGGADDQTPPEREAMNRRQNRWLRQAAAAGLVSGLFK